MIGKAGAQGEFEWTVEEVFEMMQMCAYEVRPLVVEHSVIADYIIDRPLLSVTPDFVISSRKKSGRDSITRVSYLLSFLRGA